MKITRKTESAVGAVDFDCLEFGTLFTDHMVQAIYSDGGWGEMEIGPLESMQMHPASHVFHYGQAVFEGLKAYRAADGRINLFRVRDNISRLNRSAHRLAIPELDEGEQLRSMHAWMDLDRSWVPSADQGSLYIRPFVIATSPTLRAVPAKAFRYMLIASPVGFYYQRPIRVKVEEQFTRAARGGVGAAKAAGNYGAAFMPATKANQQGFDQLVWTDRSANRNLEELGSANVFLIMDGAIHTPAVRDSILAGITRDSMIVLAREAGWEVHERAIPLAELEQSLAEGRVSGMFATGTAASVTMIREIEANGRLYGLPTEIPELQSVAQRLMDIKLGLDPSHPEWQYWL